MKNLLWNLERAAILLVLAFLLYITPTKYLLAGAAYLAISFPLCVIVGRCLSLSTTEFPPQRKAGDRRRA